MHKLNAYFLIEELTQGHALVKHLHGDDCNFAEIGVTNSSEFAALAEKVIRNSTDVRCSREGHLYFLDHSTQTVVIKVPPGVDGEATMFRPNLEGGSDWDTYIAEKIPQKRALRQIFPKSPEVLVQRRSKSGQVSIQNARVAQRQIKIMNDDLLDQAKRSLGRITTKAH